MMNPFKHTVSLRVEHPTVDPDQISAQLGIKPDTKWMAGSERVSPKGNLLDGKHEKSYWSCALESDDRVGLADFLTTFTARLEAHKDFLRWIRSTGGRTEYFVGWFSNGNSGEIFSCDLLGKLSDLCIDLSLDVYP